MPSMDNLFGIHATALKLREQRMSMLASNIPLLIQHFQKGQASQNICAFDQSGLQRLMTHDWPGNVRELRNIIERANVLFCGETVDAFGVDQLLGRAAPKIMCLPPASPPATLELNPHAPIDLKAQVEQMELERIQTALRYADGVISEAARMLTLKRTTLIEKMRKYRLEKIAA